MTRRKNGSIVTMLLSTMTVSSLLLASLSLVAASTTVDNNKDSAGTTTTYKNKELAPWSDPNYPLIDWIRGKHGGYVSDKIELRSRTMASIDDNDNNRDDESPMEFGWFALEDIPKGEVLMILPVDSFIDTDEEDVPGKGEDDDPLCADVARLVQEYQKGEESPYYVLASFILDKDSPGSLRNRQPGFWSQEARDIFWGTMLDEFLHPDAFESDLSYRDDCGWNLELSQASPQVQQWHEEAFKYFISKANGNILFPLYDLVQHRNGKWRNVILKREWNGRITVSALQKINKGAPLYKSFNRCDFPDGGCDSWDENFVTTPDLLRGTGKVEDYPRRWIIVGQPGYDAYTSVFDVDKTDDGTFRLSWRTGNPPLFVLNFIQAHLKNLEDKEDIVRKQVATLESTFERETILEYLEGYKEAMNLAWLHRNGDVSSSTAAYDPFEESKGLATVLNDDFMCYIDRTCDGHDFDNTFLNSHYQDMKFKHCPETDNSCLTLTGIIQSCTSFRPHYHESFVHIPAQYAKEMKRVAFLGGGDNLLLYEIMKYPELELVVGLELDQTVVRYSYKHFGATPYFHDPRMQWWFGDASKSFLALPKEYFGSFDLVIVDLLSFIADTLKVTEKLSLMDAAGLLMKQDGGIIVKQEDFAIKMIENQFAKYTAKMLFYDLPYLCEQTITMGSNSVDFFSAPRYNHGIKTFVRDEYLVQSDGGESVLSYPAWKEYVHAPNRTCPLETPRELADLPSSSQFGVLLIIEAEELTLMASIESYKAKVNSIAAQIGLLPVDTADKATFQENNFFVLFREGYITVRASPGAKYIGFDVMLWDNIDKLEDLKQALIVGFGGSPESGTSSFRIVSGGMVGVGEGVCQKKELSNIANEKEARLCKDSEPSGELEHVSSLDVTVPTHFLSSMVPNESSRVLVILCGEEGAACSGLDAAREDNRNVALPIYSCPSALDFSACENRLKDFLLEGVKANKKIDGIIVDSKAPIDSCQVLHRVLLNGEIYDALLEHDYLVLTPLPPGEVWRSVFIDRFRTELGGFFAPAFRADFHLSKDQHESKWSVFVSGLDDFFLRLSNTLSSITTQTDWSHVVDEVESGEKAFVVDFVPPKTLRDKYYDKTDAKKQWNSQTPVGYQTVVQMEQVPPRKPFLQNERILVNTMSDGPWDKMYEYATIRDVPKEGDGVLVKYDVAVLHSEDLEPVPLDRILRVSSTSTRSFEVGDIVLFETGVDGQFMACVVSKIRDDGARYDLAKLGIDGKKFYNISKDKVMSQIEDAEFFEEIPSLTKEGLLRAFQNALLQLSKSLTAEDKQGLSPESFDTGEGLVATAFWSHGNAVLKWNGENRIELNLFLDREDTHGVSTFRSSFIGSVGNLAIVMVDEFPRGYGRIVNFASQMTKPPTWIKKPPPRRQQH